MWDYKRPDKPFFDEEESKQIAVLLDGIFPPGPRNPGATDAGAVEYLSYLLADPIVYYEIANWQKAYRTALPWLDGVAQKSFGRQLKNISSDECEFLLSKLASGELSDAPTAFDQKQFFGVLRSHCIEGCFADQRWGGNVGNIVWQWYGYPSGPAAEFDRSGSPRLKPNNERPVGVPVFSGNAATASKDPLEAQSATVLPLLLKEAISASKRQSPADTIESDGGKREHFK